MLAHINAIMRGHRSLPDGAKISAEKLEIKTTTSATQGDPPNLTAVDASSCPLADGADNKLLWRKPQSHVLSANRNADVKTRGVDELCTLRDDWNRKTRAPGVQSPRPPPSQIPETL